MERKLTILMWICAKLYIFVPSSGADFYGYLIPFSLFLTVGMLLFYLLSYAVYASDDRIPIIV
jgi:hypothetical protein